MKRKLVNRKINVKCNFSNNRKCNVNNVEYCLMNGFERQCGHFVFHHQEEACFTHFNKTL